MHRRGRGLSLRVSRRVPRRVAVPTTQRKELQKTLVSVVSSPDLCSVSGPISVVNECLDPKTNDCDRNAKCRDTMDSYECECPSNSKDISPSPAFPGRVCLLCMLPVVLLYSCSELIWEGLVENECASGKHDCDPSAICHDNEQSFSCECPAGFIDRSPNKVHRAGRVCVKLVSATFLRVTLRKCLPVAVIRMLSVHFKVDECAIGRHTCSAQADCRDLEEGYTCECREGYVDRSPNLASQPGRVCSAPGSLHSSH